MTEEELKELVIECSWYVDDMFIKAYCPKCHESGTQTVVKLQMPLIRHATFSGNCDACGAQLGIGLTGKVGDKVRTVYPKVL